MKLLENKITMLAIAGVLALIKFGIVPLINWQNDRVAEIEKKSTQLAKGQRLLVNEELLDKQIFQLAKKLKAHSSLVMSEKKDTVQYQLSVQEQVEKMFQQHDVDVKRVSWLMPKVEQTYEEQRMEVNFSGNLKQFLLVLQALEQHKPKLALTEIRTNVSKMKASGKRLGRISGNLVIVGWRKI